MTMPPIYVQRSGQRFGPYTEAQLRDHLAQGRIHGNDLAWFEGMGDYLPLYAVVGAWVPDLVGATAPPPAGATREATSAASDADALAAWDAELGLGTETAAPPITTATRAGHTMRTVRPSARRYPKVDLGTRFVALLLDWLYGAMFMVPGVLLLVLAFAVGESGYGEPDDTIVVLAALVFLAGLAYAAWYGFTKDGNRLGAGVGKRNQGIMVVHLPTNLPASRGQSAVRQLVHLLLQLVPYVGWLVEPIALAVDPDGRRLGDRAADTQVIRAADYAAADD